MDKTPDAGGGVKATAEAVKAICDLVRPFSEPAFSELGLYIAEKIRYIRFKNSIRVATRAREILREHDLKPRPVDAKVLVSILEAAGLEEDDELVDRWARLLATAGAGEIIHPSFPAILAQLQPVDARVLDHLSGELLRRAKDGLVVDQWVEGTRGRDIRESLGLDTDTFVFTIVNLIRLGLIERTMNLHDVSLEVFYDRGGYVLTLFGIGFVKACRGPRTVQEASDTKPAG